MKDFGNLQMNAPITIGLVVISALILVINMMSGGWLNDKLFSAYTADYHSITFYVRLIGHVLGNVNWEEYLRNMLYIVVLGPVLEEKYKTLQMLIMMALTALVTGLMHVLLFKSTICGAECIVVMFIILSALSVAKDKMVPFSFLFVLVIYICNAIFTNQVTDGGLSSLSSTVGGVCGAVVGFILSTKKGDS